MFLVSRSSLSFLIQGSHADSSGWGRSTEEPAAAATSTPASASLSLQPAPLLPSKALPSPANACRIAQHNQQSLPIPT